jgi:hypothetical protein
VAKIDGAWFALGLKKKPGGQQEEGAKRDGRKPTLAGACAREGEKREKTQRKDVERAKRSAPRAKPPVPARAGENPRLQTGNQSQNHHVRFF